MDKWLNKIKDKLAELILQQPQLLSNLTKFMSNIKPFNGNVPSGPSRPMKFPYTFSAQLAQFPYKFYFKNNVFYRYYCYGVIASVPVFVYISRLANSPSNKAKWAEMRKKEHEEYLHRFD